MKETSTYRSQMIDKWLVHFKETGNPIYAWRAFSNARRVGLPIPEEVLQYLDGVAHEITGIANKPPKPKDRPTALAKALGMNKDGSGQGSVFGEYKSDCRHKRPIALAAHEAIKEYGEHKECHALDAVGEEYGISASKVRRIYRDYLKTWEATAVELVESGKVGQLGPDGKRKVALTVAGTAEDFKEAGIILSIIETRFHELP